MEQQLSRKITLTELAYTAGLSVSQLTRLFRSDTGSTPCAFLNRLRMARARVLVERTTLPIVHEHDPVPLHPESGEASPQLRVPHFLGAQHAAEPVVLHILRLS